MPESSLSQLPRKCLAWPRWVRAQSTSATPGCRTPTAKFTLAPIRTIPETVDSPFPWGSQSCDSRRPAPLAAREARRPRPWRSPCTTWEMFPNNASFAVCTFNENRATYRPNRPAADIGGEYLVPRLFDGLRRSFQIKSPVRLKINNVFSGSTRPVGFVAG